MEQIDTSSSDSESSDWDLEEYKALNDSSVRDSAASSSGTSYAGQYGSSQRSLPPRKPAINGHSSHYNHNFDDELQILSGSSSNFGSKDTKLSSKNDSKRMLPSSLQPSSASSWPSVLTKGVGTGQILETFANAWKNMEDTFSRVSKYLMKDNHHGSRALPPSMIPHTPVPTSQYVGAPDLYRPAGVVDEQTVDDERLIYQVALQDLNQPLTEANLPDGLLSGSL